METMANDMIPNMSDRHRCVALIVAMAAPFLLLAPGCAIKLPEWHAHTWINGYQPAETLASEHGTGMVICYCDTPPNRPDKMLEAARDAIVNDSKSNYVGCVLTKTYAWDRKYVAQFGVDRSPAIIVLHPDGTYHAHVGLMDAQGVQGFLATANPPGSAPKLNRFLHREPRYTWVSSPEEAETIAKESDRSMLIVYYRRWSDDLQRVDEMLREPSLFRRLSKMVHQRSSSGWSTSDVLETKYGKLKLPAIVIARPDGTYHVLEVPLGYEAIIRFADSANAKDDAHATNVPSPSAAVLGSH